MAFAILSACLCASVLVLAVHLHRIHRRLKELEQVLRRQVCRSGDLEARVASAHIRTLRLHDRLHQLDLPVVVEGPAAFRGARHAR